MVYNIMLLLYNTGKRRKIKDYKEREKMRKFVLSIFSDF